MSEIVDACLPDVSEKNGTSPTSATHTFNGCRTLKQQLHPSPHQWLMRIPSQTLHTT